MYRVLIFVVLLFSIQLVQAEIYQWVDENGKTHFTDKKPRHLNDDVQVTQEVKPTTIEQHDELKVQSILPVKDTQKTIDIPATDIQPKSVAGSESSIELGTLIISAIGALLVVVIYKFALRIDNTILKWLVILSSVFGCLALMGLISAEIGHGTSSSAKSGEYFFYFIIGLALLEKVFFKSKK